MFFYDRVVWRMQEAFDRVRGNKNVAKAVGNGVIAATDENVPFILQAAKQSPFNVATENHS